MRVLHHFRLGASKQFSKLNDFPVSAVAVWTVGCIRLRNMRSLVGRQKPL